MIPARAATDRGNGLSQAATRPKRRLVRRVPSVFPQAASAMLAFWLLMFASLIGSLERQCTAEVEFLSEFFAPHLANPGLAEATQVVPFERTTD